jgi:hypothetical protein
MNIDLEWCVCGKRTFNALYCSPDCYFKEINSVKDRGLGYSIASSSSSSGSNQGRDNNQKMSQRSDSFASFGSARSLASNSTTSISTVTAARTVPNDGLKRTFRSTDLQGWFTSSTARANG